MVYTLYEKEKDPNGGEEPVTPIPLEPPEMVEKPVTEYARYETQAEKETPYNLDDELRRSLPDPEPEPLPEPVNIRAKILDTAKRIILHDRQKTHGDPEDNFAVIANLWSAYLNRAISPSDVAMLMILVKIARSKTGSSLDNFIDIAGYAACAGEIYEKAKEW